MNEWIESSSLPSESGYYLTVHELDGKYLFKAFWYSVDHTKWMFRYEPKVHLWWNKRFEFYAPCQLQEEVDPLPDGPWST